MPFRNCVLQSHTIQSNPDVSKVSEDENVVEAEAVTKEWDETVGACAKIIPALLGHKQHVDRFSHSQLAQVGKAGDCYGEERRRGRSWEHYHL